jgi:F-type H+-transporting ATPase subunit epsilon
MQSKSTFTLVISKVNERIFHGEATSVTLPGTEGELTVLSGHEPLITLLSRGIITVHTADGGHTEFQIEKGVLEVSQGQVTVLI